MQFFKERFGSKYAERATIVSLLDTMDSKNSLSLVTEFIISSSCRKPSLLLGSHTWLIRSLLSLSVYQFSHGGRFYNIDDNVYVVSD